MKPFFLLSMCIFLISGCTQIQPLESIQSEEQKLITIRTIKTCSLLPFTRGDEVLQLIQEHDENVQYNEEKNEIVIKNYLCTKETHNILDTVESLNTFAKESDIATKNPTIVLEKYNVRTHLIGFQDHLIAHQIAGLKFFHEIPNCRLSESFQWDKANPCITHTTLFLKKNPEETRNLLAQTIFGNDSSSPLQNIEEKADRWVYHVGDSKYNTKEKFYHNEVYAQRNLHEVFWKNLQQIDGGKKSCIAFLKDPKIMYLFYRSPGHESEIHPCE